MHRNLRFGALAATLILAIAALYAEPRPADAAGPSCTCLITPTPNTQQCWGKGATCNDAVANFPTACVSVAHNSCASGACEISYVQDSPYYCWFNPSSGMWTVDGVVSFHCRFCLNPKDPIDPLP